MVAAVAPVVALLIRLKEAAKLGTTKLVAEARPPDRAFVHDLERCRQTGGELREVFFPGHDKARDAKIRHHECG